MWDTYHTAPLRESSPMLIPGLGILVVLTGSFLVFITI